MAAPAGSLRGRRGCELPRPPYRTDRADIDLRVDVDLGLQQLLPGDPALVLAGEDRDPTVVAYLQQKLHLDKLCPCDIGTGSRACCMATWRIDAHPKAGARADPAKTPGDARAGVLCNSHSTRHRHSRRHHFRGEAQHGVGHAANAIALWGLSPPNFWLGIMLILLFSVTLAGCRHRATSVPSRIGAPTWRRWSCRLSCSAMPSPRC